MWMLSVFVLIAFVLYGFVQFLKFVSIPLTYEEIQQSTNREGDGKGPDRSA